MEPHSLSPNPSIKQSDNFPFTTLEPIVDPKPNRLRLDSIGELYYNWLLCLPVNGMGKVVDEYAWENEGVVSHIPNLSSRLYESSASRSSRLPPEK
jgi:hypothetical protein